MDLRRSFTSLIVNLLIEKDSSPGSNPQINISTLVDWFLNWTDGNQTLSDTIRRIFINIICTAKNNYIFNDGREGKSLVRQRTFSTRSPLMPTLMNLLPKRLFQTLVYLVRPTTIESPVMMELMFSCLTWKQWFWWILSQLLLLNLSDGIEAITEA